MLFWVSASMAPIAVGDVIPDSILAMWFHPFSTCWASGFFSGHGFLIACCCLIVYLIIGYWLLICFYHGYNSIWIELAFCVVWWVTILILWPTKEITHGASNRSLEDRSFVKWLIWNCLWFCSEWSICDELMGQNIPREQAC